MVVAILKLKRRYGQISRVQMKSNRLGYCKHTSYTNRGMFGEKLGEA